MFVFIFKKCQGYWSVWSRSWSYVAEQIITKTNTKNNCAQINCVAITVLIEYFKLYESKWNFHKLLKRFTLNL
jgi:hypothetical protein